MGRKIGAVLAFVAGGVVAGASGMMLFAPETPGAFALAPLPKETVALDPVAVVAAGAVETPGAAKSDSSSPTAGQPAAASDNGKTIVALAPAMPTAEDTAKPAIAANPAETSPPVAGQPPAAKSPAETELPADFMVPRSVAAVAPILAAAVSAKTIPSMFLASRTVASTPHQLVSLALPALATSPRPVVTTAVALPGPKVADMPAPAAAPTPAKPRKAARTQNQRRYANDNYSYRQSRQNFFSFFFR